MKHVTNLSTLKWTSKTEWNTLAGQAGNPLTLARTRSPKVNSLFAFTLFAPFLRPGAIGVTAVVAVVDWQCTPKEKEQELKIERDPRIQEVESVPIE